jgi:TolB protein
MQTDLSCSGDTPLHTFVRMIRAFVTVVSLIIGGVSSAAETSRSLCFERGTDIWVASIEGTDAKKITRGSGPSISPDGKRIAFHTNSSGEKDLERRIAVADVATKQIKIFKSEIPSNNCQRAIWSPDGGQILFSIWTDSDWHLAMINADGSGFRYVKKAVPKGNSFWSACWAPDGKSIYAQNLDKIYQLGLDGSDLKSWNLRSLFPKGGLSSGSQLAVSPDSKTLLLDVEMEEESVNVTDWDGPPPAIWTLDIGSEKTTRLTPKGMLASQGCWLDADNILFTSQARGEKHPSIYRMSRDGKERKVYLKNATTPSVSR